MDRYGTAKKIRLVDADSANAAVTTCCWIVTQKRIVAEHRRDRDFDL